MKKEGQVTIFIILGIVALLSILFIFFARDQIIERLTRVTNVEQKLQLELSLIDEEIERCINEEAGQTISLLVQQGGYLDPQSYKNYYRQKFTYLCTKQEGQENCVQQTISKENIKERIDTNLQEKILNCLDLSLFRDQSYTLTTGDLSVFSIINLKNVLVNVTYPVTLQQETHTVEKDQYFKTVDYPLGEVLLVAADILNAEATTGNFDPLAYTLTAHRDYEIEVRKPYPDTVYLVTPYGYETPFQFATQG